jgi:HlyD family secretion protein
MFTIRKKDTTMRIGKKLWLVVPLIVASAAAIVAYLIGRPDPAHDFIAVSGNIEITDAQLGFKIPGLVAERLVREGDVVREGQVVARLDTSELVREVALRRSEVAGARAALAEIEGGARPREIEQAQARMERVRTGLEELLAGSRQQEIAGARAAALRAQAEAEQARTDFERDHYLFEKGVVSARKFDASGTAFETAAQRLAEERERLRLVEAGPREEQIERARQEFREAQAAYELIREGPRAETVAQAQAQLERTEELLALAETRLNYGSIRSPLGGVVLSENVEPGEYVAAGTPVVTVGRLRDVWLRGYIDETDLGRVKHGQDVEVVSDSYPEKIYPGRVSFIASEAEFTPKSVQTEKERVKLVYRIRVSVDNPHFELKPGMPADARILLDGEVSR